MTFESMVIDERNERQRDYCYNWMYDSEFRKSIGDKLGIVLYGPTRTGKTHLACSVANELIFKNGILCRVYKTVELPRNDSEMIMMLSQPKHTPFLVLDDVGAEKFTDRALECLYLIIEGRLWHRAPTILTTNFARDDLKNEMNRYRCGCGDRLVGRLNDFCEWIRLGGKIRRRKDRCF